MDPRPISAYPQCCEMFLFVPAAVAYTGSRVMKKYDACAETYSSSHEQYHALPRPLNKLTLF